MEKIIWIDRVINEQGLHRVKEDRNILRTMKRKKANWIGHILRSNCLLNTLLKQRQKGRNDEEKDVSSYWMTSGKREHTGT
jgi:hypothetical protein